MGKKIVVVEDNDSVRENLATILIEEGYDVSCAANGLEGFKLIKNETPALIICDVLMPKLDGFQLYSKLLENTATASIPFIFLTAKADKEAIAKASSMGVNNYIVKPFRMDNLLSTVKAKLSNL